MTGNFAKSFMAALVAVSMASGVAMAEAKPPREGAAQSKLDKQIKKSFKKQEKNLAKRDKLLKKKKMSKRDKKKFDRLSKRFDQEAKKNRARIAKRRHGGKHLDKPGTERSPASAPAQDQHAQSNR